MIVYSVVFHDEEGNTLFQEDFLFSSEFEARICAADMNYKSYLDNRYRVVEQELKDGYNG